MYKKTFNSPLGHLIAYGDDTVLHALQFADRPKFSLQATDGNARALDLIEQELALYFEGALRKFTTSLRLVGTPFQLAVWKELMNIPFGQTRSYAELSAAVGKPTAYRAAAQANGANRFPILIPCHRVINSNGTLGGYSGGLEKKICLLAHEKQLSESLCPTLE